MKQILIQLDDTTAAQLEKVAPGRSRRRSEFLRQVIARAVQDALEAGTRAAYEKWPDAPPQTDPAGWAPPNEAVRARPLVKRRPLRASRGKVIR